MKQSQSKYQFQRIMPFKIQQSPEYDACVFTTSRPERLIKFPQQKIRVKSTINLEVFPGENSQFLKSVSESSLKSVASSFQHNSSLSPTFEDNMARLSNLRYSYPKTPNPLPSIRQKTIIYPEPINRPSIEEEAEENETSPVLLLKKSIGFWSVLKCEGSCPRSCESSQILVIDSLLIVCGGESQVKHSDLKALDLRTRRWKIIRSANGPKGRLGHSMVNYKHKLFIYGGWGTSETHERRTASKMFIISLHKNKWEKCFGNGEIPAPRQYHAACQLGRSMLIYGGVDYTNRLRDDLYILDLKEKVWKLPEVSIAADPGPRSHCTLTPVFHQSLKGIYDFSIEKIPKLKDSYTLMNSGFYLFGGLKKNAQPTNDLHTLHMRNGKLIWVEAKTCGIGPGPRYCHTAHAIHSSLFIYGGRNDLTLGQSQVALNELFVYNVMNFKWDRVEVYGNVPDGRWAHGMTSYNTSLIMFGGITYHKFMAADVYLCETSRVEAEKKIQSENRRNRILQYGDDYDDEF